MSHTFTIGFMKQKDRKRQKDNNSSDQPPSSHIIFAQSTTDPKQTTIQLCFKLSILILFSLITFMILLIFIGLRLYIQGPLGQFSN